MEKHLTRSSGTAFVNELSGYAYGLMHSELARTLILLSEASKQRGYPNPAVTLGCLHPTAGLGLASKALCSNTTHCWTRVSLQGSLLEHNPLLD